MLRSRCHNRPEPLFINYKATFRLRDLSGLSKAVHFDFHACTHYRTDEA